MPEEFPTETNETVDRSNFANLVRRFTGYYVVASVATAVGEYIPSPNHVAISIGADAVMCLGAAALATAAHGAFNKLFTDEN